MHYFEYGNREITHLKAKDAALARLMDEVGIFTPTHYAGYVRAPAEQGHRAANIRKSAGNHIGAYAGHVRAVDG